MLVLSRKVGESIVIDGDIKVTVSTVQGGRVKLCIDAPRERRVIRAEVVGGVPLQLLRQPRPSLPGSVPQLAGS
jgi:carbon storage regulator